jgi:hypothetical protein
MATKRKSSARKKSARKGMKGRSARKRGGKRAGARKAASKSKGSAKRRSTAKRRRQSPVARVKRVTREVVQQAQVAVTAGVETLKDLGENLAERVPDRFKPPF